MTDAKRQSSIALPEQAAYWRKCLREGVPVLNLPLDHARPPVQTFVRGVTTADLPVSLVAEVRAWCARENHTLYSVLLATLAILLYRYTLEERIVIGSPVVGARLDGREERPINLVSLRHKVEPTARASELVRQVKAVCAAAERRRDYPFADLLADLESPADPGRAPLFQIVLALAGEASDVSPQPISRERLAEAGEHTARCDLVLLAEPQGQNLRLECEYDAALLEPETVQRMLQHFALLLAGLVRRSEAAITELPMLSDSERQQVLFLWNNIKRERPAPLSLVQLVEAQVMRTPRAVAVTYRQVEITYEELNRRANLLARRLLALNVGRESLVGICLDRSLHLVVAALGILKTGAAYVPLDPSYPHDRQLFVITDSRMQVLVTEQRYLRDLRDHVPLTIVVEEGVVLPADEPQYNLEVEIDPTSLAYVIYTSGSTGEPKGVQIPHSCLSNFLLAARERPGLLPTDVMLAVTTLAFDIAVLELLLPLITGARIILAEQDIALDGGQLARLLQVGSGTVLQATPAMWKLLIASGWTGQESLRLFCGGEALSHKLATELLQRGVEVWNLYGPTETTVWSSAQRVVAGQRPPPIGQPLDNTQFYILDRFLQPVAIGVPGELAIGGDGVSRGYLRQPSLTAEKFPPDPFSGAPGARIYRTGDLVRRLPSGSIEFLGRIDNQVKIRGFRVEPAEIEAALLRLPNLRDAVVVAREDRTGEKQLVAYLVPVDQYRPGEVELRSSLRVTLPEYMIPQLFGYLPSLPMNPNGKVDRQALPPPETLDAPARATYIAPKTDVERQLAVIWQQVLQVQRVGLDEPFFDLGGESLMFPVIQARVRELLNQEISALDLLQHPTIRTLARYLAREDKGIASVADRAEALLAGMERRERLIQLRRSMKEDRRE